MILAFSVDLSTSLVSLKISKHLNVSLGQGMFSIIFIIANITWCHKPIVAFQVNGRAEHRSQDGDHLSVIGSSDARQNKIIGNLTHKSARSLRSRRGLCEDVVVMTHVSGPWVFRDGMGTILVPTSCRDVSTLWKVFGLWSRYTREKQFG